MSDAPAAACHGIVPLSDWGVILAQGPEAATFLNGQLTQDVPPWGATEARLAGYCSAKGRLLATFVVWRAAEDQILLACSADLLAATLKRLSMFVLRAKCKLSDASAQWPLHGLAGASADAWLGAAAPAGDWACVSHGAAQVIRLPAVDGCTRYLWAGADAPELPPLPADAWRWLEVHSGIPRVVAATVDKFVPQMLNLELLGGVNFKKGCYPGQEVVARSQYRGTVKRRTYLVASDAAMPPGMDVFHSADPGQPAGMVVLSASLSGAHAALVELKIAALQGGELHAANGARLSPAALPYDLAALEL
ncbi:MAG: folate-binding protein YgfZ [Rubrivivax sp.]|nr:folate-binding protein YgfZ [Rubrivivax sp.]